MKSILTNGLGVLGCCLLMALATRGVALAQVPPGQTCYLPPGNGEVLNRCTASGDPAPDGTEGTCACGGDCYDCDGKYAYTGCERFVVNTNFGKRCACICSDADANP